MDQILTLVLILDMAVWVLAGLGFIVAVLYPPYRDKPIIWLRPFTVMMSAVLVALIITFYSLLSNQSDSVTALINQFAVISLIATILALTHSPWQAYRSDLHNDDVIKKLGEIGGKIDKLKPQDLSLEGNPGKKIIPSEIREDGDTKTITTQYESDNVTVTSTIKITIRKE